MKDAFSSSPRTAVHAHPKHESPGPDKKYCVNCGMQMGIQYQFCQRCGNACAILSPRMFVQDRSLTTTSKGHPSPTPSKDTPRPAGCLPCRKRAAAVQQENHGSVLQLHATGENAMLVPVLPHAADGTGCRGWTYDVFFIYRDADSEHAKDLFRLLNSREVEEGGRRRKLRVYWDKVCMSSQGEEWERGVASADALCSSRVVVVLISRATFVNGLQSFEGLTSEAQADDILWQWCLALEISGMRTKEASCLTVVVPVLIGDIKRGGASDEIYTDFLASADDHVGLIARSQQLS